MCTGEEKKHSILCQNEIKYNKNKTKRIPQFKNNMQKKKKISLERV